MKVLQNIAASIGVVLEPNMSGQEIVYESILQGMLELDDIEREVLVLRYGLNMDELEIGNKMGMTYEEVQKQCHAGRQKLEKMLKGTI